MISHRLKTGVRVTARHARLATVVLLLSMRTAVAQAPDAVEITVPRVAIHAGTPIGEDVVVTRIVPRTSLQSVSAYATRGAVIGKIARRTLVPGQPIPLDAIRAPPVISGGQGVRIVYQSGGLRITGEGTAQHAAGLGEQLNVRSVQSGVLVRGRVTSPRDVLVEDEP